MQIRQQNKLRSYLAVQAVCENHAPTWSAASVAEFGTILSEFTARVQRIRELGQKRAVPKTGWAAQKRHCRQQMCEAGAVAAGAVHSWALKTEQFDVARKADWSYTDLMAGRDTDSADRCRNVHKLATDNLEALAKFGVTAETLADLEEKIEAYSDCIPKPREAITTGKTLTEQLTAEFAAAEKLLTDGLDKLILQFKSSASEFFADYQNARLIVSQTATRGGGNDAEEPQAAPVPEAVPTAKAA